MKRPCITEFLVPFACAFVLTLATSPTPIPATSSNEAVHAEQDFQGRNESATRQGSNYLLSQRDPGSFGWGPETHRALTALALSGALSPTGSRHPEHLLMVKELELRLAVALAKKHLESMSTGQLALYINALLSVCKNPRDFYGMNLVARLGHLPADKSNYEYALQSLALCNSGAKFNKHRFLKLVDIVKIDHGIPDTLALTTLAFACGLRDHSLQPIDRYLNRAINKLKKTQQSDGSFGNIYSSGLVWQALIGAKADEQGWNSTMAEHYFLSQQKDNGAIEDFMGTFFGLPPLAGKTLMSLYNWSCGGSDSSEDSDLDIIDSSETVIDEIAASPISVNVSIRAPETQGYMISLKGKEGWNLYRLLEYNQQYISVEYKEYSFGHMIVAVDGIYQDPDHKKYWMIYVIQKNGTETLATKGVDGLFPENEDGFVLELQQMK